MADNYWNDFRVAEFAKAYERALRAKEGFFQNIDSADPTVRVKARVEMGRALNEYRRATTIQLREFLSRRLNLESLEKMCH